MTHDQQLAAAAERLRRISTGETLWNVYGLLTVGELLCRRDADQIAVASYVAAERNAPSEPITVEWLVSIGFAGREDTYLGIWNGELFVFRFPSGAWMLSNGERIPIPTPACRRDALELLRLLGIPTLPTETRE
jgi:hypothetical protein